MSARGSSILRMNAWRAMAMLMLIGMAMLIAVNLWVGLLCAGAALGFARLKKWPSVSLWAYTNSTRCLLPLAAWLCGAAVQLAFEWLGAETTNAIIAAAVAAGALAVVILIIEGKIMKSIFQLVPQEQQTALAKKLDAMDNERAGVEGQAADFSALNPDAVTDAIEQRVIGQDAIVREVVTTCFRRARLARPNKPVGVFLFVGATGAGKTELAKSLAAELFDGRTIRIDCNELAAEQNVQRLIGAPPGYIGADQGGQLCRDLARTGTGVLLLDEIEKAHPAALKVLMNLLDEARLTEQSTGRTYSARGFLIVLTSNAAAAEIAKVAEVELDATMRATKIRDALKEDGFLPEILARIDAIFPFRRLSSRDVARVIERFLMQFARDVGVELVSADSTLLLDLVTRAHTTRDYGVREVVRSVESAVVDGLIDAKDQGARKAAIHVRGGEVAVEPIANQEA